MSNDLLNKLFTGLAKSIKSSKELKFMLYIFSGFWILLSLILTLNIDTIPSYLVKLCLISQTYIVILSIGFFLLKFLQISTNLSMINDVLNSLNKKLVYPSENGKDKVINLTKPVEDMSFDELEKLINWAVSLEEYGFANILTNRLNELKK